MRTLGAKNRLFLTSSRRRASVRRAHAKSAARFLALGLTSDGTPRKNQKRHLPRGLNQHQKKARYSRIYRRVLQDAGLSTYWPRYGQPLRRLKFNFSPYLSQREKLYARMAFYRARNVARGLTSRGTARKLNRPSAGIFLLSDQEKAWRDFRSTLPIPEPPELYTWADRAEAA